LPQFIRARGQVQHRAKLVLIQIKAINDPLLIVSSGNGPDAVQIRNAEE
jgi:hypothetical protein